MIRATRAKANRGFVCLAPRTGRHRMQPTLAVMQAILACVILLGSSTPALAVTSRPTDEEIQDAVEVELLVEDTVSPHLIDVAVSNGIVTLSGGVSHLLEHDRAIETTRSVRGVRSIVDRLEVRPVSRTDEEIQRDVTRALFLDPAADSYEIDVMVKDGLVTLTGTVESWAEKQLAAEVVKGVTGVKDIRNGITYSYESDRPDLEIKGDIERGLKADPYVDEGFVNVEVEDGVVTVSGTVGSAREKSYVLDHARVAGIMRVVDHDLEVASWARNEMQRTTKIVLITDTEAKRAINDALVYDPRLYSFEVDVEVDGGIATLTGTVDNLEAKRAAGRDARNTAGIWKVNNHIKVRPKDRNTDAEIAENIRDALLRDPIVDRFELSVTVRNRQVLLSGIVDHAYERRQAEDVASRINGVADVLNTIIVREVWRWKADSEIKDDIESEYAWSPFVDGGDIEIRVDAGHVELGGHVDTWHEYLEAVDNAFEGGAKDVRANLWVQDNDKAYDRHFVEPPSEVWPL